MIAAVTPHIDALELGPIIALSAGTVLALMIGLLPGNFGRTLAMLVAAASALTAGILAAALWNEPISIRVIAGSLIMDRAAISGIVICCAAAIVGLAIAARGRGTTDAGHGETASLIMASTLGMAILAASNDLITVFLGLELLSIPLYILCASHVDKTASLESGLKYLILGSVGSATALMGIALLYGATGEMQFDRIRAVIGDSDLQGLVIPGMGLLIAGFAFKLSLAPLHQWTPDVYDGAPTAVTAFMSVATKTAALVVIARILITALGTPALYDLWHPLLLTLAAASIIVGNVGALGQPGLKRLMGYSSIAQAGYLVAVLSVGYVGPMLAYLVTYAVATLLVFAVIAAREAERPDLGDDIATFDGLAHERPILAWFGTIGFFGLSGLPLTAGFFGKIVVVGALIEADVDWMAVLVIVGSIVALAYYIPPVLRMWRKVPAGSVATIGGFAPEPTYEPTPVLVAAGGPTEAPLAKPAVPGLARQRAHDEALARKITHTETKARTPAELWIVAVIFSVLTVVIGVWPEPLLSLANAAASALLGGR